MKKNNKLPKCKRCKSTNIRHRNDEEKTYFCNHCRLDTREKEETL
jgi:hypothetical protein